MGIELRCASCGLGFVAEDLENAEMPCPGCGSSLGSATSPTPEHPKQTAPPPGRPPRKVAVRAAPATTVATAAPPSPPKAAVIEATPEVVCPRCSLHFTPRTAKQTKPHSERRTVLVVEDMDYFRGIARDALEPQYVVVEAETVQDAMATLLAGEIDLILLDLTLGGGESGARLLDELPFKPCPILIFTAEDESVMYGEQWDRLQELGADDLVIKGMNVGESILRKVGALLGDGEMDDGPTA